MKTLITMVLGAAIILTLVACGKSPAQKKHDVQAAQQALLKWEVKNLLDSYQQGGHTDPRWDDSAKDALTELGRSVAHATGSNEDASLIVSNDCAAAAAMGCDDPMMRYLFIRYCMPRSESKENFADAFCQTTVAMENSSYPKIRKYYVWLRTTEQCISTYGYGTNIPPKVRSLDMWGHMGSDLMDALGDKTMPPEEICQASEGILQKWAGDKGYYPRLYQMIENHVTDERAKTAPMLLLKGLANIDMAWQARGGGYASTVSSDGWKLFSERLDQAASALTKAWDLDPYDSRIPLEMIKVEMGQGKGRDQMDLWFSRAMHLDPNDYDACSVKLVYIEPKWHGTVQDMLAFGHECVQNELWGGRVPLILVDAHYDIQRQFTPKEDQEGYWKRPEVWSDLKSAFDRFFDENPTATSWYHNYAWYAYQAGQWAAFNELVPKLGPVNYSYFGGKENFDKMVAFAKAQAGHP